MRCCMACRRARREAFTASGTPSLASNLRAGVFGRGEYLNEKMESYSTRSTRDNVCSKSSSVSPGKPTMISVEIAIGRFKDLIALIISKYLSRLYNLFILRRILEDPDCTGKWIQLHSVGDASNTSRISCVKSLGWLVVKRTRRIPVTSPTSFKSWEKLSLRGDGSL